MDLDPKEYRPLLLEFIYSSTKVSRFYNERILHAPVYIAAPGWTLLAKSADEAAEHARRILEGDEIDVKHRTLDLDPPLLPPTTDHLAANMAARRARERSTSRPRPRLH